MLLINKGSTGSNLVIFGELRSWTQENCIRVVKYLRNERKEGLFLRWSLQYIKIQKRDTGTRLYGLIKKS